MLEFSLNAAVYKVCAAETEMLMQFPDNMQSSVYSFKYSGGIDDYENVSLCDVLNWSILPQAFADCIVLVGVTAGRKAVLCRYTAYDILRFN